MRMFRSVGEVGGNGDERNHFGHHRMWEEIGAGAEIEIEPNVLLHFCEILTPEKPMPTCTTNRGFTAKGFSTDGWRFVGEGFAELRYSRGNHSGRSTDVRLQVLVGKPWEK